MSELSTGWFTFFVVSMIILIPLGIVAAYSIILENRVDRRDS